MNRTYFDHLPSVKEAVGNGSWFLRWDIKEETIEEGQTTIQWSSNEVCVFEPLDFGKVVSAMIRQEYSLDDEIALSRQRDEKPEEWETYFTYVENCKVEARKILYDEEYTPVEMSATTKDYLNSLNRLGI